MVGTRTSRDDIRGGSLRLYRTKTRVSYDRRVRSTPSRHSRTFVSLRVADNSSDTFEFPAVTRSSRCLRLFLDCTLPPPLRGHQELPLANY